MINTEKRIKVEWINEVNNERHNSVNGMTNPLKSDCSDTEKLGLLVKRVLEEEIPRLKNNSLLYDLVLYTIIEKMKTVQSVENVLSYIKENKARKVYDVIFIDGEVHIKCSV